jgi:hypothetical protein
MTPEEQKAFGVTRGAGAGDHGVDSPAPRGCPRRQRARRVGIFIKLEDGRIALLTARHVIVECILTGELTVSRLAQPGVRSAEPKAIRIDHRKDAALLVMNDGALPGEVVPYVEWSRGGQAISKGMAGIVSGVVGEWRQPDEKTRTIPMTMVLNFWTAVTEPDRLCQQRRLAQFAELQRHPYRHRRAAHTLPPSQLGPRDPGRLHRRSIRRGQELPPLSDTAQQQP